MDGMGCLSRAGGLACIWPCGGLDETIRSRRRPKIELPRLEVVKCWDDFWGYVRACLCFFLPGEVGVFVHTSTTSAESSISMTARCAHSNHLSVDVRRAVGIDIARATAAVRDFGS